MATSELLWEIAKKQGGMTYDLLSIIISLSSCYDYNKQFRLHKHIFLDGSSLILDNAFNMFKKEK